MNIVHHIWEIIWQFLKKLNMELPNDPRILLVGIYPPKFKMYVYIKMCTQTFISALFITAKQ